MMDGWTLIALGKTGCGKSTLLLDLVENGPFLWVGPEPMNPEIQKLRWCYDSDPDLNANLATIRDPNSQFMIRIKYNNPRIFEILAIRNKTIVFDDSTCLTKNNKTKEPFNMFIKMARSRDQHLFISTHRPLEDMEPVIYFNLTKYIYQVGPVKRKRDREVLHELTDADNDIEFEPFEEGLKKKEFYNYERRNFNSSVYIIAGGADAPRPERKVSEEQLQ